MFKPISNPYIVGNPIKSAKMFYGRADDFQYIKTKLEDGGKSYIIVLCGERRSGKTSILFQILSGRLGDNFVPILVDMQTMAGLKNELEFFEKFAQETSKSLKEEIKPGDLFKTTTESSYKAFSGFLDSIHKKYSDKHIIFLIDEYEIIESKIEEGSLSENFIPFLAGTLESDKRISFIFTGSSQIEQRKGSIWQVLFGKSLFRNVSFLSRPDTERLILEPIDGSITYDPEALNLIYTLTYGQPFYTQVVCQNIVDYVNQKQKTHIQLEDLEVVISEILENPLPQMIYFWNSLQDDKKLILSLMAEVIDKPEERTTSEHIIKESKRRKFGLDLTVKEINTTLEALFHSNYVSKSQQGFSFQLDLFRRWIKRDHAIWRVMKEVSNLGQASSVSKIVYDDETGETGGNSKKTIMSIAGVIIVILLIWLFYPANEQEISSGDQATDKSTEQAQTAIHDENTEHTHAPETTENKPEKPIIKTEKKESPKTITKENNPTTQKPANEPASQKPAVSALEVKLEKDALDALNQMAQARDAASEAKDTYVYRQGQNFEIEGNDNLKSKNYSVAKSKFNQATIYYKNALKEITSTKANLESNAYEQQKQLKVFKQKLGNQYTLLDEYKTAQKEETIANNLLSEGNYTESIQMFKDAEISYTKAINTYKSDKETITRIIDGYLNGIQNESIAEMKKYHQNFTGSLQTDWQGLFDYADNIKVLRTFKNFAISSDRAAAQVDIKLDFKGADKTNPQNLWKFNLEKNGTSWIIASINDKN